MLTLKNFDDSVTATITDLPDSYRAMMSGLTLIGQPAIVITLGLVGFIWAWKHSQSAIEHAFVYGIIAFSLNTLLKWLLRRARPDELNVKTLGMQSYSFPSGHAFGTVIFYGLFAYLGIKYISNPVDILVATMMGVLIFLIGISRVYLGAHYPSDVVGGWLLGGISLLAVIGLAF
ncbi:MAG: phosphatase PAP2 family protein [Candidatus Saccharimonadales bacterium]